MRRWTVGWVYAVTSLLPGPWVWAGASKQVEEVRARPGHSIKSVTLTVTVSHRWLLYGCTVRRFLAWSDSSLTLSLSLTVSLTFPGLLQATQKEYFFKVVSIAAKSSRLGIFNMECQHRQNKAIAQSSANLGRAKNWLKLSVEGFLGSTRSWHERKFGSGLTLVKQTADRHVPDSCRYGVRRYSMRIQCARGKSKAPTAHRHLFEYVFHVIRFLDAFCLEMSSLIYILLYCTVLNLITSIRC